MGDYNKDLALLSSVVTVWSYVNPIQKVIKLLFRIGGMLADHDNKINYCSSGCSFYRELVLVSGLEDFRFARWYFQEHEIMVSIFRKCSYFLTFVALLLSGFVSPFSLKRFKLIKWSLITIIQQT